MSPGDFQSLSSQLVTRYYGFDNPVHRGLASNSATTAPGKPDTYWILPKGKFVYFECGHYKDDRAEALRKIKSDVKGCLETEEAELEVGQLTKIVVAHSCRRFTSKDIVELEKIDTRIDLFGPDRIAMLLARQFPGLAKEYFGMSISSGQIMGISEFEDKVERAAFASSLKNELVGRNEDLGELVTLLDANDFVLVTGRPGLGKTRLALEALRKYAEHHSIPALVIRSNRQRIWDDLANEIPDSNCAILVDDANELSELEGFADFVSSRSDLKVLMTVRDYAKPLVLSIVGKYCETVQFEVSALRDDVVMQIVEDQFHIAAGNASFSICHLAKGNMRLACSASKIAREKGIEVYSSMPDLVEKCYEQPLSELSSSQVAAAKIVSILGPMKTEDNSDLQRLEGKFGLSHTCFLECCRNLHSLELMDIYKGVVAVAPGDQVLRDYLLYKVVYVDRDCDLVELHRLERGEQRCAAIVQTVLGSYWSEGLQSEIERQLEEIWDHADDSYQWGMITRYGGLLANDALLKISRRICSLASCEYDYLNYDYCSNASSHQIEEKSLYALVPFLHQGEFGEPEELYFMALDRGIASPDDMRSILVGIMSFGGGSDDRGSFSYESKTLDNLLEGWRGTHEAKYGVLTCQYVATLLVSEYDGPIRFDGSTVYFSRGELVYGEAILSLRRKAIKMLYEIRQEDRLRSACDSVITGMRGVSDESESGRLWRATLEIAYELYVSKLKSVDKCSIPGFALLEKHFRKAGIQQAKKLPFLHADSVQDAVICLFVHNTFPEEECAILRSCFRNLDPKGIALAIRTVVDISECSHTQDAYWKLPIALLGRIEGERDADGITPELIISPGIVARAVPAKLIIDWIDHFGAKPLREMANRLCVNERNEWLQVINGFRFCFKVDDALISDVLHDAASFGEVIEFEKIMKAEHHSPGFYSQYSELLLSRNKTSEYSLFPLLPNDLNNSEQITCALSENVLPCLRNVVLSIVDKGYFYLSDDLIRLLADNDCRFVEKVVPKLVLHRSSGDGHDPGSMLRIIGESIWDRPNCFEMAEKVWQIVLSSNAKYPGITYPRVLDAFISGSIENHTDTIVLWLIAHSIVDGKLDDCFADAGMNLPLESRLEYVVGLCEAGLDPEELRRIPFLLTHRGLSWSGSEVPIIEKRIKIVDNVISLLPGVQYVEHRKVLKGKKRELEKHRDQVELREFINAQ